MASIKIDPATTEMENLEEPCKINSDEDTGKESDIDMIIDEITRENNDDNENKDSVPGIAAKPKPGIRMGTAKRTVRGRFIRQRTGRGFLHRVVKMRLPKIPDGILYVKNGTYIGYHCTYCNCALKTLLSVKQHVAGARHQETLKSKKINEEPTAEKTDAEKPSAVPASKEQPNSDLKSSLDEYLTSVTEPIVGLSHITEMVSPGNPSSFVCGLCKYSGFSSKIKEHINGTRHRLMYLKAVDPEKIAEMMSKNLTKSERNQKIIDHAKELEEKNGRGTIQVQSKDSEEVSGEEEGKPNTDSSGKPGQIRRPFRRARDWTRGRGRGQFRGGRLASIRRGMRGFRGGRRLLIRGGRRGSLGRGRVPRRSLSRMSSERRKQSIARRFRGRISHNSARAPVEPYAASYYSDYNDWVMRTGSNQYEADPYYGRDPYYPDPYSAPREYYMDHPYERMDRPPPQEVYPRYDYRPPYDEEPPFREYGPSSFRNRDQHSSPSHNKAESADVEGNPLKNLPNFSVTSEKDAGVVMNVITSLAESLLGYKMRGSPQEILQKLGEEKKKSASSHLDKSDSRAVEKFPKAGDAMDQSVHNWNESGEIRARHSGTYDPSTRGWAGRRSQDLQHKEDIHHRTPPPSRRQIDATRDRSPTRRPMDIVRDRPSSPPRRPVDMHDRSPPLQRRPMDMRARSPPRRSMDVVRDRASPPPPPKRPMDVMQDRSLPLSRSTIEITHNRSPPRGPMNVMRAHSPPLSRRSIDVMRSRSPPPSRGSASFMRDRSPPPPSFVDDMFDDYQKSQNAMRGSYSTPSGNAPPGYRSSFSSSSIYGTPASYASPPSFNTPSFHRSSEARRLSNTSNFGDNQERSVLDWKYRSLR